MKKELKILLLEDVPEDAEIIEHELRKAGLVFTSRRVDAKEPFLRELDEFVPDIILADYKLPAFDGLSAFEIAKKKYPDVIFIFVTGEMGEEFAIGTLLRGATDYVLKDHISKLAPAVRRALEDEEVRAERRRAEEALKESEERYRNVVETSPNAVFIFCEGLCVFSNRSGARLLGAQSHDEIVGRSFMDFVHHDSKDAIEEQIGQVIRGRAEAPLIEDKFIRLDGTVVDVEITSSPFTYNGRPAGLVIVRDIGDRKRMEKELLKTHKLESIGLLAGGIAHDFNNLLTAVLANISLAKVYSSSEGKAYKRLTEAENAVEHATKLVQQLLTFSRGGAPVKETSYIKNLTKDSTAFALTGSNARCEYSISSDLWPVDIDRGQMSQVISNLILNARQAMPEGGVIKVSADNIRVGKGDTSVRSLKEGEYIKISVEDCGVGIEKKYLDKIFDPYFTTKQKGSGLGLATAYSIIKSHGGHITAESQPGVGTTFYIYLPASKKEVPKYKDREEIITSIRGEKYKGTKVLVMDDEVNIRDISREMLTYLGCEVVLAVDGDEAIELYRKARESGDPFDAILMDLTIPGGMGGKEAIKKLLEIDPEVKAIVSSGYSNDPVMAEYKKYGFSGIIAKPYNVMDLSEKLQKLIAGEDE